MRLQATVEYETPDGRNALRPRQAPEPETPAGGRSIRLRPGETLFRAGARTRDLYYLADGVVRAEYDGPKGTPEVLGTFRRGDVIGVTFLPVAAFTVTALRPSRLIAYSAAALSRAFTENKIAVARLAALASKPVSQVLGFLYVCRSQHPSARIAAYILYQFDRRGEAGESAETVDLRGSPRDWAKLLNVTCDHVERGLAALLELEIIERVSATRIALLDRKRLEDLADLPP